jgi:hypothetical protein
VLGQHGEAVDRLEGRRAAAGDDGDGDPCLLEEAEGPLEEDARVGITVRKGHEALEVHPGEPHRQPGEVEGGLGRLHPVPPAAGVALDEEGHVHPVPLAGLAEPARHGVVVEHDGQPLDPSGDGHQAIRLRPAEDVVAEEDVGGDTVIGEYLELADLLADDPHGSGLELHLPEGRDLVSLDVGPVADAVAVEQGLHAADVRGQDVEVDGDDGGVEGGHGGHQEPPQGRVACADGSRRSARLVSGRALILTEGPPAGQFGSIRSIRGGTARRGDTRRSGRCAPRG